jgi:PAS domain S-box-containing protein
VLARLEFKKRRARWHCWKALRLSLSSMTDFIHSAAASSDSASARTGLRERIRSFDWAQHPLGPQNAWPLPLRFAVEAALSSPFPQCVAWGDALYTLHNDAYARVLEGRPCAIGKPFHEVWQDVWPRIGPHVRRAQAGETTYEEDFELVVERNGVRETAYYTFGYSPVRAESGEVLGIVDVSMETTDKVRVERRLRETMASLEQQVSLRTADRNRLWQRADALLMVMSFDGTVVAVNPAWTEILGWTEVQTVGRSVQFFAHPDDVPSVETEIQHIQSGAGKRSGLLRFLHRNGTVRYVSWSAVQADNYIQAVGRDVTEEQSQAEALRSAEDQLRHSQKMEALGQLTGGIAHDLNNMLQGIVLPLQIIRQRITQGRQGEAEKYITSGLSAARRAASLTQRLLAFSRRQPLDSRPVDLAASVRSLEPIIRTTCGENIALQVDLPKNLWPAFTDAHQFDNAVLNLCINARDAMPVRGTLRIALSNVELSDSGPQSVPGLGAGEYVRVAVSDSGAGMPEDVKQRAFDPFFTTKPLGQGTGLGLSMIYGFMRQSGGLAVLESAVGQGTRASLYFCRSQEPVEAEPVELPPTLTSARRPDSALVVEDDETVRVLAVELLRDAGYQVMEADSGSAALAMLSGAVHFDLLLSDMGLPGPNGRQVADYAREKFPLIKVILMTGYAEQAALDPQFLGAQMELMVKPFDAQSLVNKVHAVMERVGEAQPASTARK